MLTKRDEQSTCERERERERERDQYYQAVQRHMRARASPLSTWHWIRGPALKIDDNMPASLPSPYEQWSVERQSRVAGVGHLKGRLLALISLAPPLSQPLQTALHHCRLY